MTKIQNSKPVYDLGERNFQFAKAVRLFVKYWNLRFVCYLHIEIWDLDSCCLFFVTSHKIKEPTGCMVSSSI